MYCINKGSKQMYVGSSKMQGSRWSNVCIKIVHTNKKTHEKIVIKVKKIISEKYSLYFGSNLKLVETVKRQ